MSSPTPQYPRYPGTETSLANPFPSAATPGATTYSAPTHAAPTYSAPTPTPPPPAAPTAAAPPPAGLGGRPRSEGTDSPRGVVSAMFDFKFHHFAALGLIRFVYIAGTVVIGVVSLIEAIVAFGYLGPFGIIALIAIAFVVVFEWLFFRVILEFCYSLVRMSEDIHGMRLP